MINELKIGKQSIYPGEHKTVHLKVGKLYDSTDLNLTIQVMRGLKDGPTIFLSAAIHGDELNGIEIIREVMSQLSKTKINGTVIAVPIVNVFGFNNASRYLPDRRDLNRSFPGNIKGSLASRIAHLFMKEVVSKCTHGIDFHTGAIHRSNYPQIRANLAHKKTLEFARFFNAPITINSKVRDGSLREAARKKGVNTLLFEGGQALRFEEKVIKIGVRGCLRAMRHIGIIPQKKIQVPGRPGIISESSGWVRSPVGGTMRIEVKEGSFVKIGDILGRVSDPFERKITKVIADCDGYVIGINKLPLVTAGEAVIHIASTDESTSAKTFKSLRDEVFP